jgi:hypothetical protein
MSRESYVFDPISGEVVERDTYYSRQPMPKRSHLPCPRIAGDSMEPVQSQLDGKLYDSKSALRATYRAAGVIEVGNDPARLRPRVKPRIDRRKVRDTIEKATARFERGERA